MPIRLSTPAIVRIWKLSCSIFKRPFRGISEPPGLPQTSKGRKFLCIFCPKTCSGGNREFKKVSPFALHFCCCQSAKLGFRKRGHHQGRHSAFLIRNYGHQCEDSSWNVFYTGAAPNQQAIPAVEYLMSAAGGSKPLVFTCLKTGQGLEDVITFIREHGMLDKKMRTTH
jgi:hypothetical protein